MFFEKELISFKFISVFELKQENVDMWNAGRRFHALSFRFHADTYLRTETAEYHMTDNSMAYVPAHLGYGRSASIDELIAVHFETENAETTGIEIFVPKNPDALANLFREILDCWKRKEVGYKYECSALLCKILRECHVRSLKSEPQKSKIQKSVDFILKNYTDPHLSIQKIAEQSFISEVYFRKLFKEEYGISPQKYIINLRIQHALGLLWSGYYSLKEIAYMSGYNDYKYFSVEFKKAMGSSPSQYVNPPTF